MHSACPCFYHAPNKTSQFKSAYSSYYVFELFATNIQKTFHSILLLAKQIGLDIIVCHYPPYASKWNPIEHRLFAHVHRAIQGAVFTDYELVAKLINKTKTKTGLKVVARLNQKRYNTGIKTPKSEIDYNRIQFHPQLPVLSYRICA